MKLCLDLDSNSIKLNFGKWFYCEAFSAKKEHQTNSKTLNGSMSLQRSVFGPFFSETKLGTLKGFPERQTSKQTDDGQAFFGGIRNGAVGFQFLCNFLRNQLIA